MHDEKRKTLGRKTCLEDQRGATLVDEVMIVNKKIDGKI